MQQKTVIILQDSAVYDVWAGTDIIATFTTYESAAQWAEDNGYAIDALNPPLVEAA